jgi:hypothetical protein
MQLLSFAFVLVLSISSHGRAQVCFRYEQTRSCSSYPMTDFIISAPVFGAAGQPERHLDLATNLGWLFNVSECLALGPSFFFSAYLNGGWHSQLGLHGRLRVYPGKNLHVDVSPGLVLHDSPFPEGFAGYSAEAAIGYRDWVSLVTRVDVVRSYPGGHDTILHMGIKFGSYAGLGLTGIGAVAGGIGYILSRID